MYRLLLALALAASAAHAQTPPPPAPGGTDALLAATDDITRQVVALRNLQLTRPFARGVLSRDQIGAKLRDRIGKEYTPEEIRSESRVLKRLGLLAPEADYEKLLMDVLMEQVAGFYDPFARELYIADWIGGDLMRPAMAHEIEHALQDQHFDLKKFATPLKDDGDRQLARSAVVEGDGTEVMLEFVLQGMNVDLGKVPGMMDALTTQLTSSQLGQSPALAKAPRFLRDTLTFPYFAGLKFVSAVKQKGWGAVDAAFKTPPESTEQILHPEKFFAHEHPVTVTPSAVAALAPAKELRRDVLGEFEWRLLLASRISDAEAERAAAGWGGDRLVAYADGDGPVSVIDLSTWDSDDDALQAEVALRRFFALQQKEECAADQPAVWESGGEAWSVERHGRQLLALFGVPAQSRATIADEVWKGWKVAAVKPAKAR